MRPQVLYRMDNGETYSSPVPEWWGRDEHTSAIQGVTAALKSGEPIAVECKGVGWVIPNPAHIVTIEFVGDWEVSG